MNPVDYITDVRFYPGGKEGSALKARGSLTVGGALAINFTVFEKDGKQNLVLPRTENPKYDSTKEPGKENRKYFDEVFPVSADARTALEEYILGKLRAGGTETTTQRRPKDEGDPIPF